MTADYPDYQTHQAHANAIAATGAPALRLSTNVGANAAQTLAGGASTFLIGPVSGVKLSQTSLQIMIQAQMPLNTGAAPFLTLVVGWSDSQQAIPGGRDVFILACGNNARLPYNILMPFRGDAIQVSLGNNDASTTATFDWSVNQTSHPFTELRMIESALPPIAVNGFTRMAAGPANGVLGMAAPTVAFGASADRIIPAWAGDALLTVDNSGGATPCQVDIRDFVTAQYSSVGSSLFASVLQPPTSKSQPIRVALPNGPALLRITNTGTAGSITPTVTLMALDR